MARTLLRAADRAAAAVTLARRRERPMLLAFAFHHIFEDQREVESGHVDPHQPIVAGDLEVFLEHFLQRGYRFVGADAVADGLPPGAPCAMVTFDDGYHSALRAMSVLQRFGVPGTFFISASYVAEEKAYWWDVLYRERSRRGTPAAAILREKEHWLRLGTAQAEAHVRREFGSAALSTRGTDSFRTLTAAELKALACHPMAVIGNHTADHTDLTMLSDEAAGAQIGRCQMYLVRTTGTRPRVIAYPHGRCSSRVAAIAHAEGLRLGFTAEPCGIRLPIRRGEMTLGRYCLTGDAPVEEQCRVCRSGVQLLHLARRTRMRLRSWA